MRDFFFTVLIVILVIVFALPEFLKLSEYDRINKIKGEIQSNYFP